MLTVPVEIKKSEIHGTGLFAIRPIPKGTVLWMFHPGIDRISSDYAVKYSEHVVKEFIRERGYFNEAKLRWVLCGDEAQFLNFPRKGQEANIAMGDEQDGEKILLAARDIESGEELLVPPESDGDYERKMVYRQPSKNLS